MLLTVHLKKIILLLTLLNLSTVFVSGQMRKVFVENDTPENEVHKISFYSPSQGYVAFRDWVGFTQDSGKSFIKKPITNSNVDYNGNAVNLTFGFGINGVKAFDKDVIVVYGEYGLVPAILYSANGGNSFKLVYHSQYSPTQLKTGIVDMVFPENNAVGYAIDADRILKTSDKGLSWTAVHINAGAYFEQLVAIDNNNVLAFNTVHGSPKFVKTNTAGTTWMSMTMPATQRINSVDFLTASKGWINITSSTGDEVLYYTSNGGNTWELKNNSVILPLVANKMKFVNDSTGFAIMEKFLTVKTSDSGRIWEPIVRDNQVSYLGYTHNDLFVLNKDQLWSGGGHGLLELNASASARPLPKAYFKVDTTSLYLTKEVKLNNYSKPDYSYQWFVNSVKVSEAFHYVYIHNIYRKADTIKLVVSNGIYTDTTTKIQLFNAVPYPKPIVHSYAPVLPKPGTTVTIKGDYFGDVTAVAFGGVPARSFVVNSLNEITAVVDGGGNGAISVTTASGEGLLAGFVMYPPPVITSFSPVSAPVGSTITINGSNFSNLINDNIVFFGSVKAPVLTASINQLTVSVPAGASFAPITVTVNNHSAYSSQRFSVTFPSPCGFSEDSFDPVKTIDVINLTNWGQMGLEYKDLNNDGRAEIITITSQGIAIAKNTGSPGTIDFDPVTVVATGSHSGGVAAGDLNGDGKPDLAVTNRNENTVSLLANTSTGGAITFAPKIDIPTGGGPTNIVINDLDGDGKPELVVLNSGLNANTLSIYRNISANGVIAFAPKVDMKVGIYNARLHAGDLDGDGKADLFIADAGILNSGLNSFSVYRNTSVIGAISFADIQVFNHYTIPFRNADLGDVDGDGKLDIAVSYDIQYTSGETKSIALYRNTSTPGNISFDTPIPFESCKTDYMVTLNDLDGDGKIDLFSACGFFNNVQMMKNTGSPGSISMTSVNSRYIRIHGRFANNSVADLDGDGKPDLVRVETSALEILRNTLNDKGAFAGKDTTICQGQRVQLGKPAITGYTYQWTSNPAGFTSNISDPMVTPLVSTTYYLAVTNPNGCVSIDSIKVNVGGAAPLINAGSDQTVCNGTKVQIGGTTDNVYTYSWTSTPAGFFSVEPKPEFVPSAGTRQYILSVKTGSCIVKDTVTITVVSPPVADAGVDKSLCVPNSVRIGVTGLSNLSYSWTSNPAGFTASVANPTVAPVVTTSYYLTVTNLIGCSSKDTVTITAIAPPPTPIITASGPTTFCKGGSVTLNSASPTNNQWFKDGYVILDAKSPSLEVKESGDYTLRTNNGLCYLTSAVTKVMVGPSPEKPTITINGGTIICGGNTVALISSITTNNQWYRNGIPIENATNQVFITSQAGSYTVKAILGECTSALSDAVEIANLDQVAKPVISTSGPTSFCAGNQVVLQSSSTTGNQWYLNGILLPGATSQNYTASVGGQYSVRLVQGTCLSDIAVPVVVTVNPPPPVPIITVSGNVLSSSSSAGNRWLLNGVNIPAATNQQLTAAVSGQYQVKVTQNGCSSISAILNFTATNIVSLGEWNGEVKVYPNPVENNLFIDNKGARHLQFSLIDINGRQAYQGQLYTSLGTINMEKLSSGVYQLIITDIRKKQTVFLNIIKP